MKKDDSKNKQKLNKQDLLKLEFQKAEEKFKTFDKILAKLRRRGRAYNKRKSNSS
jgi:hypothetical protein